MHLEFDMPVSALQSVPFTAILNFFFFFFSLLSWRGEGGEGNAICHAVAVRTTRPH